MKRFFIPQGVISFIIILITLGSLATIKAQSLSTDSKMKNKDEEKEEFYQLLEERKQQKNKNLDELNVLFNNDNEHSDQALLIVNNTTPCNIIMRITGEDTMSIPIAAQTKEGIVLRKGTYSLKSKLCGAIYQSIKEINITQEMTLNVQNVKK